MTIGAFEDAPRAQIDSRKARILVIDDEVGATRLLKRNLEQTGGYDVRAENTAETALSAAIEFVPDLILLDVMMPGRDGGEVAELLRSDRRFKSTPIVFLTAAATRGDVKNGGGIIGGMPFLAKPAGLAEVLACLEQQLDPGPTSECHG
jgi:DNA-binding response OmpR family regulator